MTNNTPFTELDFALVKENLKTYLKGQERFKDYDFEGSNINVLLDILAYNMFQHNVYNNMVFAETFLDSAQLRENVMSHAKELNYVPSSRRSATAKLDLRVDVSDNPSSITIPRGTRFSAKCGNKTYTFTTNRGYTVFPQDGVYTIQNVDVQEGKTLNEFYTVDESKRQQFTINNENVDISSIRVHVRDNTNPNSSKTEYTRATGIFGVDSDDPVFYIEPDFDNLYKIEFGRNRFGSQPINGNVIEIEYRVTKGEQVNGASNFRALDTINGAPIVVTSQSRAVNGAEMESLDDIKFFAPKSIQNQERAVTETDYEILLKQRFPNIQAISVYGGDLADPPQYGKVIISVDVLGSFGAGDSEIQAFSEYIKRKTPLTIDPVFVPAKFLYADVDINVVYDPKITTKTTAELRETIINSVLSYSESTLNEFNRSLRQSRLSSIIDSSDSSIVSSDVRTNPIIEYTPTVNIPQNPSLSFQDTLLTPYTFNETVGVENYRPAVSTSPLTIEGTTVTLQDDGRGDIIAITANKSNRRVFKRNIGSVDYDKGLIQISKIVVERFEGNAIKFTANTTKNDIKGIRDRILAIREQDVNINFQPVNR